MALINCPDCNHQVSDNAAACPTCGNILKAYNDLNFPGYHVAAVALVVAILAPVFPGSVPWWLKILMSAGLAFFIALLTWIVPGLSEHFELRRNLKKRGLHGERYASRGNRQR